MNADYSDITREMKEILSAPYEDGDILENRYRILSQNPGRQGQIYYCYDLWSQVPCVLKTSKVQNPDAFQTETKKLLNLPSHKNVVKLYRFEQSQSGYYTVMEWLPNSLKSLIASGAPVSADKIASIALSVCLGISHCSKYLSEPGKPFVHGHLRPANLLFTWDGDVKIADLIGGTYPLQTPAFHADDDIFSLGKMMEMLFHCGKGDRQPRTSQEQQLEHIIQGCIAKQPKDRIQSFQQLMDLLTEFLHLPSDFDEKGHCCADPEEKNWLRVKACDWAILGEYQKADRLLSQLLEAEETNNDNFLADACCSLAEIYRNQKMFEKALPLYEKAIAYDGDRNSYLWTSKGITLRCMDRREDAFQCFFQALTINPYDFPAIKNELDILCRQGRIHELKKAKVRLLSLYKKQPDEEELLKHIGYACYALKEFEQARSCFQKYLEYNHNDWEAIYYCAMCLYTGRDITHSRKYFQTAVRKMEEEGITDESQTKLMYLSVSLYNLGDFYGAMEYLEQYQRNFGSTAQTKHLKLLLQLDCQLQEKYGPLLSDVYRQLTNVIFTNDPRKHYTPMLEQLISMKEYWEQNKLTENLTGHACDMYLSCLDYLVACCEGLGETERALAYCDQILSYDRSLPEGLYNKGRNLFLSERVYESLPYFQAALQYQQDPDTRIQMEESLHQAQSTAEASPECRKLFLEQIINEAAEANGRPETLQVIVEEKSFFLKEEFPDMLQAYVSERITSLKSSSCGAGSLDAPIHNSEDNVWKFILQILNLAGALQQISGEKKHICASGALSLYRILDEYAAEAKDDLKENLSKAREDLLKKAKLSEGKTIYANACIELGDILMEKYLDAERPQEMLKEAAICYHQALNHYRQNAFPRQYAFLMLRISALMEKRYRLLKDHSLLLARVYFSHVTPNDLPEGKEAADLYRRMKQTLQ